MNTYLPNIEFAANELTRLEGIRDRLAGLIIELQSTDHHAADAWISIYTDRLTDNVLPAIKEARDYLKTATV